MMGCNNCFWCRYALKGKKVYKCKLYPKRRFNYRLLHGWFCKDKDIAYPYATRPIIDDKIDKIIK